MDRRFTKEEAQRIFAAAAERQQRSAQESEADDLTLSELEDAARDAGIDPSFVRAAAIELARPGLTDVRKRVLGLDVERRRSIYLPGRMADSDWSTVVHRLRDLFDERGVSSELSNIYEWSSHADKDKMPFHVTAEVLDDGTRVTIERDTASHTLGLARGAIPFVLVTLACVIASFFGPGDLWKAGMLLLPIAMIMVVMAFAASHFGGKKEARRFEQVFEVFRDVLPASARSEEYVSAPEPDGEPHRPVDLLDVDDTSATEERPASHRRKTRN